MIDHDRDGSVSAGRFDRYALAAARVELAGGMLAERQGEERMEVSVVFPPTADPERPAS